MESCSLSEIWDGLDFSPCFRAAIIDTLIPIVLLLGSSSFILKAWFRSRRSFHSALYAPLKQHAVTSYGTTSPSLDDNQQDDQDDNDTPSSSTIASNQSYEVPLKRWSIYNLTRLTGTLLQLGISAAALRALLAHEYTLDTEVEGSSSNLFTSSIADCVYWTCLLALSMGATFSSSSFIMATITKHVDILLLTNLVVQCVNMRSFFLVHYTNIDSIGYTRTIVSACVTLFMLAILIHEERGAPGQPIITDTGRPMSTEMWASTYSKFMFSWVAPMLKEGYQRTLNADDLVELTPQNRAKNVLQKYQHHRSPSLFWGIIRTYKKELATQAGWCILWNACLFGPPVFLNKIIKYIENPHPDEPPSIAYYVLLLFLSSASQALALQQALYIGRTLGVRVQAIIVGEVFAKALRKREGDREEEKNDTTATAAENEEGKDEKKPEGNVNNLLSVDSLRISDFMAYSFQLYGAAIQMVVSVVLLYNLLGTAALWGLGVMVVTQPVVILVSQRFEKIQDQVMSATDNRIKKVNELLSSIRIIKFFAWEKEFKKRVMDARENELKLLLARLYMHVHITNTWFFIPILIMITVFYAYTRTYDLTAATAFTALALFNILRFALDELPMFITWALQGRVSAKRVQKFLAEDEVAPPPQHTIMHADIGFVDNAAFGWEKDKPIIKNLNLSFPRGKLSVVCGPTGSGKTTLLASLLGETYRIRGSAHLPRTVPTKSKTPVGGAASGIAYVAQTAWLQNRSIRDNILFGLPYDPERYEQVLYITALTKDLEIFEYGDSTEIGEKGVTLSGGQKQRMAIARAVYSQAETVILDDCLSAVDAHTAKHLYEHCITGNLMKGRTVILVTHHVALCLDGASYVVAMKDGQVLGAGDPSTVLKSGALGEELANTYDEERKKESGSSGANTDGIVPVVPEKIQLAKEDGTGKLVKEEERAEGWVSWSVYEAYIHASGGYAFWGIILVAFCLNQAVIFSQDYWIKVWTSAYETKRHDLGVLTALSTHSSFLLNSLSLSMDAPSSSENAPQQPQHVNVTYYLGIYALIGFLALLATTARSLIIYYGSIRASRRLHEKLLQKILRAKIRFFDSTPLGRILNRFSTDMEAIDQEVSPMVAFVLFSIVSMFCMLILVSTVLPAFLIPGTFIAVIFVFIGMYYLATSRDMKRLNSVSRSPIYVQFSETLNGVSTIRAFGAQPRFVMENYDLVDNNNRPFLWMWATNRWLHSRIELLGSSVCFFTGLVIMLARSWIDPGLAGLCLSYALQFTDHIIWIVRGYAQNEMNMNSIERVQEYMDIEEEAPENIPATCPPKSWPETGAVKVEDLEMRYSQDSPAVLHRISFETKPREKVGIVGRTGSGKSTLALSIFRFMEASHGRILIDDVDIATLGLQDLRSRLTIIPQDPVLFSGTLRSNLDPFGQHDDAELWAALKRSHLIDQQKGGDGGGSEQKNITLDSVVLENGNNWSQGQRQLIALARALVKKSTLIILDEATSSVDFDTDRKIQETIRTELTHSSLLCIAHRIRTVADYDRILVLDQGRVKEFDTPYNLITREDSVFRQMCQRSGEFDELLEIASAKHSV
ncbi:atp-dependent bile acid permease [Lichtheimia corymbifera JMRC:FSU:9682]|uniref:Atp-dependent bile acid permease n=1 Tax=Lichtheimia corymbifera JMRC:FSU:9682 TaxID=1263082 RepID=A0A068RH72_9FUNG|nr:atp-dependent bile acid permease [Lichtheimia corymbifera JMRC:FSU:9682]